MGKLTTSAIVIVDLHCKAPVLQRIWDHPRAAIGALGHPFEQTETDMIENGLLSKVTLKQLPDL